MTQDGAVRLLVSDVDGTLVTNERVLTDRAVKAVEALRLAGVDFALASSRPPRGLRKFIKPLGLTLPLAGLNGGILVNPDLSIIETRFIGAADAKDVVDVLQSAGLDIWIYTDTEWFVQKAAGAHVSRETWILGFEPAIAASYDRSHLEKAIKIVGVSDNPDLVASGEAALEARLGARVGAARSEPHFIDITSPQANKGVVIGFFARRLSLPALVIATIGDMPNDVLMFKQSGVSFAMGNASPDVQAAAGAVTASNQDEGFAKAVEQLLVRREDPNGRASDNQLTRSDAGVE